jgi:hypothetical protein
MNDPFASVCRACGARNAFGPSAYAEEPVAPPPTKRSPMSASAIARWGVAVTAVLVGARLGLSQYLKMQQARRMIIQPISLETLTVPLPTATALPPALAAKLPPARRFALTSDGRAISFVGSSLKVHTRGGAMHEAADVSGALAPRADSPLASVGDAAYWIVAGDAEIASVRLLDWKPASVLKGAHAIGALASDDQSIWFTATDGKQRKLFRLDVTSSKPAAVASWASTKTNEILAVAETDVFVVEPAAIVRVAKANGKTTTLATVTDTEEVGALATSADAIYFTTATPGTAARDLWRVPLAGGERTKVMTSTGAIGDIAAYEKDVVMVDRPAASWQVDSLPDGDVAQVTIVASDVGRQPHLIAAGGHIAWSTTEGVTFTESN